MGGRNIAVTNPILKGFNPDPSILRVGDDFYIATSTFEWFPGIQIHHSRDLQDWTLLTRPLNRASLINMEGEPDSCGVWAPCLTYDGEYFYLFYTDVKRFDGNYKDTHNYLTRCRTIDGDWEDPVYINSPGFDPSLFHDDDGRKYVLNMQWDHRPNASFFNGIWMQEYCVETQRLLGEPVRIFGRTKSDCTEGPHIYKRDGWYYLMMAEGGTSFNHAVTVARSRDIWGPYEVDPILHMLTAKDHPDHPLQRTGHASLVDDGSGNWYLASLCGRPSTDTPERRCIMGRETCLVPVYWNEQGWRIFDVSANGASAVAYYRTYFGEMFRRYGPDAVLSRGM